MSVPYNPLKDVVQLWVWRGREAALVCGARCDSGLWARMLVMECVCLRFG